LETGEKKKDEEEPKEDEKGRADKGIRGGAGEPRTKSR